MHLDRVAIPASEGPAALDLVLQRDPVPAFQAVLQLLHLLPWRQRVILSQK
jgi:hypothetical protein